MAKVKFYRGGGASSLPQSPQDGAIFIVERGDSGLGDIYVDVSNAKRLHITPDKGFFVYDALNMSGKLSQLGEVYILLNEEDDQIGVKVGDGKAFIGDLPTYNAISQKEKNI